MPGITTRNLTFLLNNKCIGFSIVADIEDTEVIWIALLRDTQINWFYLKIEQNKNNINNYTYK